VWRSNNTDGSLSNKASLLAAVNDGGASLCPSNPTAAAGTFNAQAAKTYYLIGEQARAAELHLNSAGWHLLAAWPLLLLAVDNALYA